MSRTFYPQQPPQEMEFSSLEAKSNTAGLVEFSSEGDWRLAVELCNMVKREMRERCARIAENSHYWESPQMIAERIRRGAGAADAISDGVSKARSELSETDALVAGEACKGILRR